ncbi:MAG: TonB family protein [Pseudomonadota bacterium]
MTGREHSAGKGDFGLLSRQSQRWVTDSAKRFAIVGIPAAFTTFALFLGMTVAIETDGYTAPEVEPRELIKIALPKEIHETIFTRDPAPVRQETVQPPALPKQRPISTATTLPLDYTDWLPSTDLNPDIVKTVVQTPAAIGERIAQPIAPPIVVYPPRAIDRGIEGTCEVMFDVSLQGQPFNVKPACTDRVFEREAKRAIEKVSFMPHIRDGQPVERRAVVYPIEFKLDDG